MSNDFWCHPQRSALSSRVVVSLSNVWNFVIILDGRWFRLLASCRLTHLHLAELKVFLVVRGSNVRDSEPEISCVGVWWWETKKEEFVNNEAQRNNKKVKNKKKKILTHQSNIVHFDHRAHSMISNHDEEIPPHEYTPCLPQCPLRTALDQPKETSPRCPLHPSIDESNHHPLRTRV